MILKFTPICLAFAALSQPLFAQSHNDSTQHRFNLHFQTTYICQYKPAFSAAYSGPNSLITSKEKVNSITSTLYLGARLWKGAEAYINPELAGGKGLSGAFGLAASANGETFRVGNPEPTLYLARAFFIQSFSLDKEKAFISEDMNEIGGAKPVDYLSFVVGKICLGDILDNNAYANSPRTQFINWCLMNNGAWDYAANTRGYTLAIAAIAHYRGLTYKAALATLPKIANGPVLNTNLGEAYSINGEVSRLLKGKRVTNIRLLAYHNHGGMGSYAAALRYITSPPDIIATRQSGRSKTGLGLSADRELTNNIGVFCRLGWNDGKNETWAFTEADRTASLGIAIDGAAWKRKDDGLSIAIVANGLSEIHRQYLAAGGLGFQLGDGKLNYGNEAAAEMYYSYKPFSQGIWLSADYQFILNPGYNKDRGPVNVFSFRLHVEL